ncbi:hypothetical protein [Aminivibrio sp.]|uniref:hypothetical protein n=1 Tax=Aminivibrio sp. TaxID=1872489 RepID=UPI001A49826B|nr:hypothetical protein [Aminivibrio sp.]MBL3539736.1 hypothetical protein [Aminivibrio sp.]
MKRLGFVGFGEAAFHMAKGLGGEGVSGIVAYDAALDADLPYNLDSRPFITRLPGKSL